MYPWIPQRVRGTYSAFRIAYGFGVSLPRAAVLGLRYLFTGRTGKYRIGPMHTWRT